MNRALHPKPEAAFAPRTSQVLRVETPPKFRVFLHGHEFELTLSEMHALHMQTGAAIGAKPRTREQLAVVLAVVLRCVCDEYEVRIEQIMSKQRFARICFPRMVAMTIVRERRSEDGRTMFSLTEVGKAFHRDHGTVLHAVRTVSQDERNYPEIKTRVQRVRDAVARAMQRTT